MNWFAWLWHKKAAPPATDTPIDMATIRFEMSLTDPDFTEVRDIQHDALNTIAAHGLKTSLSLRKEREFWQRAPKNGKRPRGAPP